MTNYENIYNKLCSLKVTEDSKDDLAVLKYDVLDTIYHNIAKKKNKLNIYNLAKYIHSESMRRKSRGARFYYFDFRDKVAITNDFITLVIDSKFADIDFPFERNNTVTFDAIYDIVSNCKRYKFDMPDFINYKFKYKEFYLGNKRNNKIYYTFEDDSQSVNAKYLLNVYQYVDSDFVFELAYDKRDPIRVYKDDIEIFMMPVVSDKNKKSGFSL